MGQPIKERGIRWQEKYGEKSSFLKKAFKEQVGPGSYFRWEGHDGTTGTDYYVVVTPGFSDKKGYYFFAGLRKMPADHGASGKKFPNQRMALSHAYDTWGVPPPQERPGKPYTRDDLVGKDIVLEGTATKKEASSVPKMIITSPSRKRSAEAMSMYGSARYSGTHRMYGKTTGPAAFVNAAMHGMGMGYAASANTIVEFINTDAMNFDPKKRGENTLTGQQDFSMGDWPAGLLATCDETDEEQLQEILATKNRQYNRLFESKERMKAGVTSSHVVITPPAFAQQSEQYRHIYFSDIKQIYVTARVGALVVAEFKKIMERLVADSTTGELKSAVSDKGVSYVEERASDPEKRSDALYRIYFPFDLFGAVEIGTGKVAQIKFPTNEVSHLQKIFDAAKSGRCFMQKDGKEIPLSVDELVSGKVAIMERFENQGPQSLAYDPRGVPLGIALGRKQRMGLEAFAPGEVGAPEAAPQEAAEEDAGEGEEDAGGEAGEIGKRQYDLKKSVRKALLAKAGGSPERLRQMIYDGAIRLTPDMFVVSETCAYEMNPIIMQRPNIEGKFNIPKPPKGGTIDSLKGKLLFTKGPISPETEPTAYPVMIGDRETWAVRVVDPKTRKQKIVELPAGMQPRQKQSGTRTLVEEAVQWTRDEKGNWYPIKFGEWPLVDDESKGKFIVGATSRLVLRPFYRSPKGTDQQVIHSKGQKRQGYYLGSVDIWASKKWEQGSPPDPNDPTVEIVKDAAGKTLGYYHVSDRQHPETPFSRGSPTKDKPLHIPVYKLDESSGQMVRQDNDLVITADMAEKTQSGLIFKDSAIGAQLLKGVLAMSDEEFGAFTPINAPTQTRTDDLVIASKKKFKEVKEGTRSLESLSKEERILYDALRGDFTLLFKEIDSSKGTLSGYSSRIGPLWGVKDSAGQFVLQTSFATEDVAAKIAKILEEKRGETMTVALVSEKAPIVEGYEQGRALTMAIPPEFGVSETPEIPVPEGEEEAGEEESPMDAIDKALNMEPELIDVPEPEIPGAAEGEIPSAAPGAPAAPPPSPAPPPEPPANIPGAEIPADIPGAAQVPAPAPAAQPLPAAPIPAPPQAPDIPSAVETEEERRRRGERAAAKDTLARLVALANRLDEDGRSDEAEMVDRVAKKAAERISER